MNDVSNKSSRTARELETALLSLKEIIQNTIDTNPGFLRIFCKEIAADGGALVANEIKHEGSVWFNSINWPINTKSLLAIAYFKAVEHYFKQE